MLPKFDQQGVKVRSLRHSDGNATLYASLKSVRMMREHLNAVGLTRKEHFEHLDAFTWSPKQYSRAEALENIESGSFAGRQAKEFFRRDAFRVQATRDLPPPSPAPIFDDEPELFPKFLVTLRDELNAAIQPSKTEDGWTGESGISTDFSTLTTHMGEKMNPRGHNSSHTEALRQSLGLLTDMSVAYEPGVASVANLFDYYFSNAQPNGLSIRKGTSSGPMDEYTDAYDKTALALRTCGKIKDIVRLIKEDKFDELKRRYRIVLLSRAGGRVQQERASKKRETTSPLTAYYGIPDPEYPDYADKTSSVAGLTRGRYRIVNGLPTPLNVLIAEMFKPFDDVATKRAARTFKNKSPEDTCERLKHLVSLPVFGATGAVIRAADVVTYDRTFPEWLHWLLGQAVALAYDDPDAGFLYQVCRSVPTLVSASPYEVDRFGVQYFLSGDPEDWRNNQTSSLMSGIFTTSLSGRLGILANHFYALASIARREITPDEVAAILEHKPVSKDIAVYQLNGGDDHMLVGTPELMEAYGKFVSEGESLFRVEYEDNSIFLGTVYVADRIMPFDSGTTFTAYPNIISFVVKTFAPEKPWFSKIRRDFFDIGLRAKLEHYATAPAYDEVVRIVNRVMMQFYGVTWVDYCYSLSIDTVASAAAHVLADPDTLYYKYDIEDFDEEELTDVLTHIPERVLARSFSFSKHINVMEL